LDIHKLWGMDYGNRWWLNWSNSRSNLLYDSHENLI
jgi:hypothetical protein